MSARAAVARHPSAIATAVALVVLAAGAALRWAGRHGAPMYPDGYQYLVMARGIAEHLRPVAELGAGGDLLLPSADAAAKPLYPALVALVHVVGVSFAGGAAAVTALAAALVVVLAGALARQLTGSWPAAAAAAAAALLSPAAAYWAGFPGPDPPAQALGLAAALALVRGRAVTGGVLAGLAAVTRPEYALVGLAAALAGLVAPRTREAAARALAAGLVAATAVVATVRPPLVMPPATMLAAGGVLVALTAGGLLVAGRRPRLDAALILAPAGLAIVTAAAGRAPGLAGWARGDAVLAALSVAALGAAALSPRHRASAARLAMVATPLAVLLWTKNGGSERYVAQLTPVLCLAVALGIAAVRPAGVRRPLALAACAALLAGAVTAPRAPIGGDTFTAVAAEIPAAGPALLTAAPDAYGTLLPGRAVRGLRAGERGLVLLDGAQRAYQPTLRARGRVVARIAAGPGFLRPDGRLDRAPAVLVRGRVVHVGDAAGSAEAGPQASVAVTTSPATTRLRPSALAR